MTNHACMRCGARLHSDEIALYRKIVCRGATQYLCLDCLAADIPTTRGKTGIPDSVVLSYRGVYAICPIREIKRKRSGQGVLTWVYAAK